MVQHRPLNLLKLRNGNIVVPSELPGFVYWGSAVFALLFAGYALGSGGNAMGRSLSYWVGAGFVLLAAWSGWKALNVADLEFDVGKHCLLHGKDKPVRFAEIACIEISVRLRSDQESRGDPVGRAHTYTVDVRLNNGSRLRLGRTVDQMDASDAAAMIAGLIDKPVKQV